MSRPPTVSLSPRNRFTPAFPSSCANSPWLPHINDAVADPLSYTDRTHTYYDQKRSPPVGSENSGEGATHHGRKKWARSKTLPRRQLRVSTLHPRKYPSRPVSPTLISSSSSGSILPSFSTSSMDLSSLASDSGPTLSSRLQESARFWVALYFAFNLCLTLFNKIVLVKFPFPYTLTAVHALFGYAGCAILIRKNLYTPTRLNGRETCVLVTFSVLYTVNIAASNSSLQLVTVAFHQVVRSSTPIFTLILHQVLFGRRSSRARCIALTPVILGVCFATYGDYDCTVWGFVLTLAGTILASLKTIFTNVLQVPPSNTLFKPRQSLFSVQSLTLPRLQPFDLLYLLSPLAFIQCIAMAHLTGELNSAHCYAVRDMSLYNILSLALNGSLAFGLNVVSFNANRKVGALGMTVAANMKQALTVLCAVTLFNLTITPTNGLGIVLTLIGGAWFAHVDFMEKRTNRTS